MPYRVKAVPREGHDGRNRDGRRFLSAHWTELADDELTDAIRNDPLLIVERVEEGPVAPTEAEQLRAELAEAQNQRAAVSADYENLLRQMEEAQAAATAEKERLSQAVEEARADAGRWVNRCGELDQELSECRGELAALREQFAEYSARNTEPAEPEAPAEAAKSTARKGGK